MMPRSGYIAVVGALIVAAVGAWLAYEAAEPLQAENVKNAQDGGSGILDDMVFSIEVGSPGKAAFAKDTLSFANGMFVSTECRKLCGHFAAPYFVRHRGKTIQFVGESRCANKDATIVWRGTVDGGTIKGTKAWTVSRWYWTIEKQFRYQGALADRATPIARE